MAPAFHVVIERPRDAGAGAAARLADAIAARYGLPAAQLRERIGAGRLRVKSNVDLATAQSFAADLERLGAVCAILDAATGEPIAPAKAAPKSAQLSSGLSAAYSQQPARQDLGALSSGELALATLDGDDDRPEPMLAASFGPPASVAPLASPPPIDMFAPPDAENEPELALALDDKPRARTGRMSDTPAPGTLAAPRASSAPGDAAPTAPARRPGFAGLVADRRIRLAAGVALAILLGFLPASVVASIREDSAFDEIDADVQKRYAAIYSEEDWYALDGMLARERTRKEDERRNIALGSMLIWALAGGGIAFLWFRKIDWDNVVDRLDR